MPLPVLRLRFLRLLRLLLLLLVLLLLSTHCSCERVSEWDHAQVSVFVQARTGIRVDPLRLQEAGITGYHLLDNRVSAQQLGFLGVTSPREQSRIVDAIAQLDREISTNATSLLDWRAANQRLTDYWILPLSMAPRAFLLWVRFFDAADELHATAGIDDSLASSPLPNFVAAFVFAPHLPRAEAATRPSARMVDDHASTDTFPLRTVLVWTEWAGVVNDVLFVIGTLRNIAAATNGDTSAAVVAVAITGLLYSCLDVLFVVLAFLSYYVLYWVLPSLLSSAFFFMIVCGARPLQQTLWLLYNLSSVYNEFARGGGRHID